MDKPKTPHSIIRTIYMYLVCLVAIVTFFIGSISALNITIKYFVFDIKTLAYEQEPAVACQDPYKYPQKEKTDSGQLVTPLTEDEITACIERVTAEQITNGKKDALNSLSWALAALLVALPIWLYHWRFIRK
jgi:hypothetical protein